MDQIDHFILLLQQKFGHFTVVENPSTGVGWPADTFLKLVAPLLWKHEDQLELFFKGVELFNLVFRDEAKEMFTIMAAEEGIFICIALPRAHSTMKDDYIKSRPKVAQTAQPTS